MPSERLRSMVARGNSIHQRHLLRLSSLRGKAIRVRPATPDADVLAPTLAGGNLSGQPGSKLTIHCASFARCSRRLLIRSMRPLTMDCSAFDRSSDSSIDASRNQLSLQRASQSARSGRPSRLACSLARLAACLTAQDRPLICCSAGGPAAFRAERIEESKLSGTQLATIPTSSCRIAESRCSAANGHSCASHPCSRPHFQAWRIRLISVSVRTGPRRGVAAHALRNAMQSSPRNPSAGGSPKFARTIAINRVSLACASRIRSSRIRRHSANSFSNQLSGSGCGTGTRARLVWSQ
ncbi:hypothetical protein LMG22931_07663 [Paraburkholderia nemoris]|nr:hypothetical protein LMG22931_07663 [Paraburkholderia nemoris]